MTNTLPSEAVARHAGFVMTHAAIVVSVLEPHELICPFAVVTKGDNREILDFEAETQDQSVNDAWASLETYKEDIDLWGMAREGLVSTTDGKEDVLVVAAWTHGMQEPVVFTQKFLHRGSEFELVGPIEMQAQANAEELRLMREWFSQGIDLHPKSAKWWSWANAAQLGDSAHAASRRR